MRQVWCACALLVACADATQETPEMVGDEPDALVGGPNLGGDAASDGVSPDAAPPGEMSERCGEEVCDGYDRDCDGRVDEGCACGPDTTCYGGPASTRGVGACADGSRDCDDLGELWNDCRYWVGPGAETCDDGTDDDCDGTIDEGCAPDEPEDPDAVNCVPEICDNGVDDDCDGRIDEGCEPGCLEDEICGDALDNDCDGAIDEACEDECPPDVSRACFPGPPQRIGVGACRAGTQHCVDGGVWGACEGAVVPGEEVCDDGVDNDCDGLVDEGCRECGEEVCDNGLDDDCDGDVDEGCGGGPEPGPVEFPILLFGDCLTVRCPAEKPHPVGCAVFFTPGDDRGCVASRPDSPVVYFQAGDSCSRGFVTGTLICDDAPGDPLSEVNCPINKPVRFYPPDRDGCPETDD